MHHAVELENIGSRIDMQYHAGNGRRKHCGVLVCGIRKMVTSNRATVTVFVTV